MPEFTNPITVKLASLDLSAALRPSKDEHVRALTTVIGRVPPILVHRASMQVLDGHMRVLAARLAGLDELPVEWVDDRLTGWLQAVAANAAHGLPLTARQRAVAARRVLELRPEWSNRRIAEVVGVDEATVRRARAQQQPPGADAPQLETRVGRDGSRHPVDRPARRDKARQVLMANPALSNAEVARDAGLSPTTVAAVRRSLQADKPSPRPDQHRRRDGEAVSLLRSALSRLLRAGQRLISRLVLGRGLRKRG